MPKKPIDYSKAIIYKIVCKDITVTECYVGSTTDLTRRRNHHKCECQNHNRKHYHCYIHQFIRENNGFSNFDVVKVEDYPCSNREDLYTRKRQVIEELGATLNKQIPSRTREEYHKEYNEQNRDKKKEYYEQNKDKMKEYREQNKDRINARNQEKLECQYCGKMICRNHISTHHKTQKCQQQQ